MLVSAPEMPEVLILTGGLTMMPLLVSPGHDVLLAWDIFGRNTRALEDSLASRWRWEICDSSFPTERHQVMTDDLSGVCFKE